MVKGTGDIEQWILNSRRGVESGWRGHPRIFSCPKCKRSDRLESVKEGFCDCGGYPDNCPGYYHVECKNCGWDEGTHY